MERDKTVCVAYITFAVPTPSPRVSGFDDVYRLSRNSFQNSVRRSGVKREKYYSRLFRSTERSRRVLDFLVYKHVTPRGVKHAAVSSSSSGSSDSYWAGLDEEDRT